MLSTKSSFKQLLIAKLEGNKHASELYEKKLHYKQEREIVNNIREIYEQQMKSDEEVDLIDEQYLFWSLDIVNTNFLYKVVIPKYGNKENYYNSRGHEELDFFVDVMEKKQRV